MGMFRNQNISQVPITLGYGYLYNWYTVNTGLLAPTGWHVPTDAEWTTLTTYLGGNVVAGGKLKEIGTTHWTTPNTGATNETGFTALGGGLRHITGVYYYLKESGYCWSSTESGIYAWTIYPYYLYNSLFGTNNEVQKIDGCAVRCMRTTDPGSLTVTDYDGNIYHVVLIGTQYWTVENLKVSHLNDGTAIPNVTDNTAWGALTTPGRCVYNNDITNK
jgi:uncharacterized protein (TIGR02145 family)